MQEDEAMADDNASIQRAPLRPAPGETPEIPDKLMTPEILDAAGVPRHLPDREPPPGSVLGNVPQPEATLPGVEYRTLQASPPPQEENDPKRGKKKTPVDDPFAWLAKRGHVHPRKK